MLNSLELYHARAVGNLQNALAARQVPFAVISDVDFPESKEISFVHGWTINMDIDGQRFPVRLFVDAMFPFSRPRLFTDKGLFLKYPHIDNDGGLCLFSDYSTHFPTVVSVRRTHVA